MKRFVLAVMLVSLFMSSQLWAEDWNLYGSSRSGQYPSQYTPGKTTYAPHSSATTIRKREYNGRNIGNYLNRTGSRHRGSITKTIVGSKAPSTDH